MCRRKVKYFSASRFLAVAWLITVTSTSSVAQTVRLEAEPGPYYAGEPVVLQVTVSGVDAKMDVACEFTGDPPDDVTVHGPRVDRSVQRFMRNINGNVSQDESASYQFRFTVTANKTGEFLVGPFEVTIDGEPQEISARRFRFGELESDPDMRIAISLPSETVYVGQEVPVTIRWSFAGTLNDEVRYAFSNLQIRSPLFDQFFFKDIQPRTATRLSISTAEGSVEIEAEASQEKVDGQDCVVVTGQRIMIPDAPGHYEDIPVTCRTQRVSQWGRSLFGELVARRHKPAVSAGQPLSLTVKPVPQSGRPVAFSGAVGRGFSIDVSANRSVVRVGDPISLNVTVRGNGNLGRLSLPRLDGPGGLSATHFQVPEEPASGVIDGNQKQFKVTVRVKEPAVEQIPSIAFSWFDPYEEHFSTTRSKPIALQVLDTEVVSAADVISPSSTPGENAGTSRSNATGDDAGGDSSRTSFVGANLAITRDPTRLLNSHSSVAAAGMLTVACYVLALALLVGSVVTYRRASRDEETLAKRKLLKRLRARAAAAKRMPAREAAVEIARAMRELVAAFEMADRKEIDELISRCDNIIYATGTAAHTDLADILSAAERTMEEAATR